MWCQAPEKFLHTVVNKFGFRNGMRTNNKFKKSLRMIFFPIICYLRFCMKYGMNNSIHLFHLLFPKKSLKSFWSETDWDSQTSYFLKVIPIGCLPYLRRFFFSPTHRQGTNPEQRLCSRVLIIHVCQDYIKSTETEACNTRQIISMCKCLRSLLWAFSRINVETEKSSTTLTLNELKVRSIA